MSVDKATLDEFWKLSSENENKRINATYKIISYLEKTVRMVIHKTFYSRYCIKRSKIINLKIFKKFFLHYV